MRKPKEHTTLRCTGGCPFAWFSQNQAGGTSHYGCKIDPGVSVSEDDFAVCKASLEVLENHPMADIFFKDIILAKREERQASGFRMLRDRVVFCETGTKRIRIGDKIKTDRARILLINDLSQAHGIRFDGCVDMAHTDLSALPDGLEVRGTLNLNGCDRLTSLPKGLIVGENLVLDYCVGIPSIPDDIKVGGKISAHGTGFWTIYGSHT